MNHYLRSLISATEPLAAPASADAAAAFEQHITVEAPAPARPIPSASASSPQTQVRSAEPAAPRPRQPAFETPVPVHTARSPLPALIEAVQGWTRGPHALPDIAEPPAAASAAARPEGLREEHVAVEARAMPPAGRGPARRAAIVPKAEEQRSARMPLPGVRLQSGETSTAHTEPDKSVVAPAGPEQPVEVHIGSIVLNVEAPTAAAPPPSPAASPAPQAPKREARRQAGPRFSARRHYLRWI